jgi:hypothetical protein
MDVFLTSPWIPAEWIRAHGLQPRGLWSAENFPNGSWPLSAGVCAFAEAAVQFVAALGREPLTVPPRIGERVGECGVGALRRSDSIAQRIREGGSSPPPAAVPSCSRTDSAIIFSTSCDQMRRGFDTAILRGHRHAFLFNLPATWQTPAAGQIFRSELERLGKFLVEIGGHAPSPAALRRVMSQSSQTRKRLLQSAQTTSPRQFAEALARFHWNGSRALPPPQKAPPANQIPIALIGGPFLAPHWKLLDELEAAGGRVALNATEMGERSLSPSFAYQSGAIPPFDALVRGYCDNIIGVFQRPNTRLYAWLKPRLASRGVRGILLRHFTGCDLWRAEAQTLRETFALPLLLLEAGSEPGAAPRELNRLQAFMETLT